MNELDFHVLYYLKYFGPTQKNQFQFVNYQWNQADLITIETLDKSLKKLMHRGYIIKELDQYFLTFTGVTHLKNKSTSQFTAIIDQYYAYLLKYIQQYISIRN